MDKRAIIMWSMVAVLLFSAPAVSAAKTTVFFFHGSGCPHCAQMADFLAEEQQKYPDLEVRSFEVYYNRENHALFEEMSRKYSTEVKGVPTLFVNDTVIIGFTEAMRPQVDRAISDCINSVCLSPERVISPEYSAVVLDSVPLPPVSSQSPASAESWLFPLVVLLIIAVMAAIVYFTMRPAKRNAHKR